MYSSPPDAYPAPSVPSRRPVRMVLAILLSGVNGLIELGLLIVILAHLTTSEPEFLVDAPLVLLVPLVTWSATLTVGLARGRRWSRSGIMVTLPLPLQVPLYSLFIVLLAPLVAHLWVMPSLLWVMPSFKDMLRLSAVILCTVGVLVAIVAPLLLLGRDITAYLNRGVAADGQR